MIRAIRRLAIFDGICAGIILSFAVLLRQPAIRSRSRAAGGQPCAGCRWGRSEVAVHGHDHAAAGRIETRLHGSRLLEAATGQRCAHGAIGGAAFRDWGRCCRTNRHRRSPLPMDMVGRGPGGCAIKERVRTLSFVIQRYDHRQAMGRKVSRKCPARRRLAGKRGDGANDGYSADDWFAPRRWRTRWIVVGRCGLRLV